MSVSKDADHFFQTSTSLAESDRKRRKASNSFGDPIKLPSKLLAITTSQSQETALSTVLVAEAGGTVTAVNISTGEVSKVGTGAKAPITCLTNLERRGSVQTEGSVQSIFAGGWDKTITRYDRATDSHGAPQTTQKSFNAHTDFVKCLLVAKTSDNQLILISGGADGDVNIWTFEGQRLACLRPQSRGIECLALDPFSTPEAPVVFFATSQREIYSFTIPRLDQINGSIQISPAIVQHETSVYKLEFDNDGDLWTASADKTAKRLVRNNNFVADTVLAHPDFVRDIVVYSPSGIAITACRDEEIRVWNTGSTQLMHVFSGHFEEVTGLTLIGSTLVTISIDATLRRWNIGPRELSKAIEDAKDPKLLMDEPEPKSDLGALTEDEEAQLRALMEEEEEEALHKMAVDAQ